jgi:hypothetical protein
LRQGERNVADEVVVVDAVGIGKVDLSTREPATSSVLDFR